MHKRVIPRDFFNDSKLLKCLGQFQLCAKHTGANGLDFEIKYDGEPFEIFQHDSDGSLSVLNYSVFLKGSPVALYIPYNAKENYPLIGLYKGEEYYIFDEKGKFMPNFGDRDSDDFKVKS